MYIYNLTAVIEPDIYQKWQDWIKNSYISEINQSKNIKNIQFFKILTPNSDINIAIQHQTDTPQKLLNFIENEIPILIEKSQQIFGEKVLLFGTELKEIFITN